MSLWNSDYPQRSIGPTKDGPWTPVCNHGAWLDSDVVARCTKRPHRSGSHYDRVFRVYWDHWKDDHVRQRLMPNQVFG